MELVLDAFHDMLFVFTQEGVIGDYLSTDKEDELIYPEEYFLGKHHSEVLPPNVSAKLDKAFKKLNQQEEYKFDYKIEQDDSTYWYEAVITKLSDKEELKYLGAVRNITKRKETELELRKTNEKLEKFNRQKDKLFSVISHDLKNAFSGVVGANDLILEDFNKFSEEELLDYLKLMNKKSKEAFNLLNELLLWSRNQFKSLTPKQKKNNLSEIANRVLEEAKITAGWKSVYVNHSIPGNLYVHADTEMLKTILRNLIGNAIKFSHKGDNIELRAKKKDATVEVSVSDEGVGMDRETQHKVMDKKTTYTTEGTAGEKGSGLGLDLCIDFVEKHGGELSVQSNPGEGATFSFVLPGYSNNGS